MLLPAPRGLFDRGDDAGIAGAAAQVPAQDVADLGFGGVRIAGQVIGERHQNARRAEAALQSVMVANACCSGLSVPSGAASDSTVLTSRPSAWTASVRHERVAMPSISTVQAPHTPCSQPTWVPVTPSP